MSYMSYLQSKKIVDLIAYVAEKYKIKIEVENEQCFFFDPTLHTEGEIHIRTFDKPMRTSSVYTPLIQSDQIKQILIALEEVLGENLLREEEEDYKKVYRDNQAVYLFLADKFDSKEMAYQKGLRVGSNPVRSKAEALCQKWLDGLKPLIETNPDKVLSEFIEILENLLY